MAFFKFRLSRSDRSATVADSDSSAENVEAVRRRARYRLIGSVVLVTTAVVGFPLLFDTQPRPVSMDTPIVIPSRQVAQVESVVAPPQLPALPAQSGLDAKEEVVKDEAVKPAEQAQPVDAVKQEVAAATPAQQVKPAEAKTPKSEQKPEQKKAESAPAKSASMSSAERAQALLDGKSPEVDTSKYLIQVGAFTEMDKVKEVRSKLERAGLTTYTQVTDTKDNKKLVRVRLGPFKGKAEVDKVAERVRKLGLKPAVLKL
jgi:DedD protein